MLDLFLILIVTLVAAALGCAATVRVRLGRWAGVRHGQGRKIVSSPLAALLECVTDGLRSALVAAWARPAPAIVPQALGPRARLGAPPGRPHGDGPDAIPRALRTFAPGRRR